MSMIEFSYKNLPNQLKPCFLYFGGLLKGKDIHVTKLIRPWVAEGFVEANIEKGPEDAAQVFLEDLISRNLVMNVEKRLNGKVKTCRIHDLLHKFCLGKAKEENFFRWINRFNGEDTFPEEAKEYRLFVHSMRIRLIYGSQMMLRKLSCLISGTFDYSKIVKGSFPSRLRELTLLKFRLRGQISAIGELPNLEILKLLVRAFEGDEWEVKDSEFLELKYLELDDLNIAKWSVSDDAFPMLERLALTKCKRLEKIPSHFDRDGNWGRAGQG
ncbi:putative late blight resistance protein homolog R1B-11 [Nicotiana tabacum]|uniref:Late blight resistance protein homolog R1B-11 n=1 Tax=Nicotiana tabacum TaxID=4097 RepID=A0AC58TGA8_TOBAC